MSGITVLATIVGVLIALLFIKLWTIERRLTRLVRLEAKVDALLRASAIEFDELQNRLTGDVRQALDQGNTTLAMQRMREATGLGLKEAKQLLAEIRSRQPYSG